MHSTDVYMFNFKPANSNCRFGTNELNSELKSHNIVQLKSPQGLPDLNVSLRFESPVWQGADETDLEILFLFCLSDFLCH